MTTTPLDHPQLTLEWDLKDAPRVTEIDKRSRRRLTIQPHRIKVHFAHWHVGMSVYIEGRVVRQSDGQLGQHQRIISYHQEPTFAGDNALEEVPDWVIPYLDVAESIVDWGLHPEAAPNSGGQA